MALSRAGCKSRWSGRLGRPIGGTAPLGAGRIRRDKRPLLKSAFRCNLSSRSPSPDVSFELAGHAFLEDLRLEALPAARSFPVRLGLHGPWVFMRGKKSLVRKSVVRSVVPEGEGEEGRGEEEEESREEKEDCDRVVRWQLGGWVRGQVWVRCDARRASGRTIEQAGRRAVRARRASYVSRLLSQTEAKATPASWNQPAARGPNSLRLRTLISVFAQQSGEKASRHEATPASMVASCSVVWQACSQTGSQSGSQQGSQLGN